MVALDEGSGRCDEKQDMIECQGDGPASEQPTVDSLLEFSAYRVKTWPLAPNKHRQTPKGGQKEREDGNASLVRPLLTVTSGRSIM